MKLTKLFILLLLPALTFGQMKQGKFVLGPKVGVQMTRINIVDNPTTIESKNRFDFNAGVFGRLNFGKFSIQPEVMYQEKGGNFTGEGTQQQSYQYLSTPIILGYKIAKGINLEVGPEYSWALNAGSADNDRNIYGPDARNDLALVIGTRIDMLDALSMFSVNIRYVQGLTNVTNRTSTAIPPVPLDFRNRTLQLSISYNFSEYYKWWKKYGDKKKKK
ncbi:MAG: hypothetical protein ACI9V1_003442 [Spirosomataceae bacterium]|jgi:hypothetical protein